MSQPFSESLRYEYPLTPESIVLDCGGYEGRFAETLVNRYGCTVYVYEPIHRFHEALIERFKGNPRIKLFNHGVAGTNRVDWFCIKGDMTGKFADTGDEQVVWLRDITQVIGEIGKPIALLKLNIEGLEYEVLERLWESPAIDAVQNIQVQCHGTPGCERYEAIRAKMLVNHELTFDFPFVWQNFRYKYPAAGGFTRLAPASTSQAGQDTFAREAIGDSGYFLDIGCSDPTHLSNTAVLEAIGWTGVRMDVAPVQESQRKSLVIICDAAQTDWPKVISNHFVFPVVDYLSLDIDAGTLRALRNLLPHVRFKVATVEHDYYRLGHGMKDDIRHEMKLAGYSLLCANVCHNGQPFEDWWIDEAYFRPKSAIEVVHEFTPDTYFDKILVINLDRRPDRWEHCLAELKKHGIKNWQRFVAHDLLDGNRGCTASHRGVLEIIAHNQWKRALVLEDDFEIVHENFGHLFSAAMRDVEDHAPDWDMLYIGGAYGSKPQSRVSPHVIRVDTMMTTSSYGITCQQAHKMAPSINCSGPIDSLYGAFTRVDKCYCIQPRLIAQYSNFSDLTKSVDNNRPSMLDPAHEKTV